MNRIARALVASLLALASVATLPAAHAQEAAIRKTLAERIPQMGKIDEVSRTPMNGLYEVRIGNDLFYTDAQGQFLIQGNLIDTKNRRNLTEERMDKLLAIDFASLPMQDAFTIVRGNGKRRIALFQDPNCPYCKRFERDLQNVDNITIHMFLYPILGPDSVAKSRGIWCAKDKGKAWQDWMLHDQAPSASASAGCDSGALTRNTELGRKHRITGTPTLVFADGSRIPGAINAQQIEQKLAEVK